MSAKISVVIPTHNRAALLKRALISVQKQTYPPREVVVVDDGSDDGTLNMLAERFSDLTVVRQRNRGVSSARNHGVRASHHEWVAFLDSDDEWLPGKLEAQVAALEAEPECRLCHCDEIWMRDGVRVNPGFRHRKAGGWIFRRCLPLCAISPSATVLHRSVFEDVGFFDEDLPACEDYDFWLRFTAGNPVAFVDRLLMVKHGGREDQLSHRLKALDGYRIQVLARLLEETRLEPADRAAAVATLLDKISIYRSGAVKRGRFEEAERLERLAERYRSESAVRAGATVPGS